GRGRERSLPVGPVGRSRNSPRPRRVARSVRRRIYAADPFARGASNRGGGDRRLCAAQCRAGCRRACKAGNFPLMAASLRHAPYRWMLLITCGVLIAGTAGVACGEAIHRKYEPRPVNVLRDAPYLLPDGSLYIVGDDTMEPLL